MIRTAQGLARDKKFPAALDAISRAIERTDNILSPYFLRADIRIQMNDISGAEQDRDKIDELLQRQGGFSEGDEAQLTELKVRLLIERRHFKAAKDMIEFTNYLPQRVRNRLLRDLARSIGFAPESTTREMLEWSKSFRDKR